MEDSQQEQQNEALIEEMLQDAKKTEIPSDLTTNPIIHRGDETLQVPMTVKEISSAGYIPIWDTRTYEKAPVLYYMAPAKLRQIRPDGSRRFTTVDPGKLPKRGTIKCMLHAEGENRGHYDTLGFRVCRKSNITNPYQLKQHMIKKHPQEWAAIEEERKERERQEDRALQRLLLTSQMPSKEVTNDGTQKPQKEEEIKKTPFVCETCGADFGTQNILNKHKKEQHN